MNLKELQAAAHDEQQRLERHYHLEEEKVRVLAHMAKITEEVGELSEEVLAQVGMQRAAKLTRRDSENLKREVADVLYATAILADTLGVDLEQAMTERVKTIKKREG